MTRFEDALWGWHLRKLVKRLEAQVNPDAGMTKLPNQGPWAPQAPDGPYRTPDASVQFPTGNVQHQPSGKTLKVLVANTPALRATGLQNRDDVGVDGAEYDGMLFQWPADTRATMHNKGVSFPVAAAFFDSSGMYRDHFGMLPDDGTPKTDLYHHRYALEMHQDAADALGLGPGSSISVADSGKSGEKENPTINLG